jgi:hypothetical protein
MGFIINSPLTFSLFSKEEEGDRRNKRKEIGGQKWKKNT